MSRYREQVAAALAAVTIRGPARYAWLGRPGRRIPAAVDGELSDVERRDYLVSCLREELYCSFYCHGEPVPARWGEPEPPFADPSLVDALSEANTGRGSWEPGWTVERVEDGTAVVSNAHLRARAPVGACRGAVDPGNAVDVALPKELTELSPGFYTAIGETSPPASVVRVYWNIAAADAPALVSALVSRLNGEGAPFRLKVADHPYRFGRCDAAVLYLDAEVFPTLRGTLVAVAAALRLQPRIPAFTLEHTPGVGLAEDPGHGASFGERRCALLADAIVRAHERGIAGIEAVASRFAQDGVDIDAPYLEPSLAGRHVL